MKNALREWLAVVAVLVLGGPAKSQTEKEINPVEVKEALLALLNSGQLEILDDGSVALPKRVLEESLGTALADADFLSIAEVIEQMQKVGVAVKAVTPDEMILSTQEYAL